RTRERRGFFRGRAPLMRCGPGAVKFACAPWICRFEHPTDDGTDLGVAALVGKLDAGHFEVSQVCSPALLQAVRRSRAERIAARVDRRQVDAAGEIIVAEATHEW